MDAAKLDLEYTQVTAPIDGRVSRAEITVGNYVNAGETILTSVVSLDPIYVYFEGDEQTYLKYSDLAKRGERPSSRDNPNPVFIGLANETDFPHAGKMNFLDNALNPQTGTIRARALLDNPEHLFTPGMLARVKLQGSGKYTAALIDDAAVATDQDRKYVMVVNAQNTVEYRSVDLGGIYDNRRVVRSGLQPGERIVVGGLQRVRPGMTVAPQEVEATANTETKPPADLQQQKEGARKVAAVVEEEKQSSPKVRY
jgi:RND family efflux transporter MFP subunit